MRFVSLFICLFFFLSCYNQDKKEIAAEKYRYKTDKRTVYGMDLTVPGPYELYINDIAARKDYGTGMHNTFIEVNPYVLKSGTYKFTLKLLPMPSELAKGGIQPSTIDFLKVAVSSYEKTGTKQQAESYEKIKIYPIAKIDKPVPFYEVQGEFKVDLPYELEGWSNGQNLSKMDKAELEKKVVAFYEKARTILNTGDADTWMEMTRRRANETYIFNYSFKEDIEKSESSIKKTIKENAKGKMVLFENYKLFLYANGKIATLERIDDQKKEINGKELLLKGESALFREAKVSGATFYPIKIYLPQGSNDFVIIRK